MFKLASNSVMESLYSFADELCGGYFNRESKINYDFITINELKFISEWHAYQIGNVYIICSLNFLFCDLIK